MGAGRGGRGVGVTRSKIGTREKPWVKKMGCGELGGLAKSKT